MYTMKKKKKEKNNKKKVQINGEKENHPIQKKRKFFLV